MQTSAVLPMKGMESSEPSRSLEPDFSRASPSRRRCVSLKPSLEVLHMAPSAEPAFTSGGVLRVTPPWLSLRAST